MRVICTGISGTNRMDYLRELVRIANAADVPTELFDVRDTMFQMAASIGQVVAEETILDMFPDALVHLRATALEYIASQCDLAGQSLSWIINTHAVFRWKNTLISGFDPYYLNRLKPDAYVTVTDGVQRVRERLREHPRWQSVSLQELLVWREEEQFSTEEMARMQRKPQFLFGRAAAVESLYRLLFRPGMRKIYLSYPMQHVSSGVERGLADFKARLESLAVVFDPADVNDFGSEQDTGSADDGSLRLAEAVDDGAGGEANLPAPLLQHIADQIVWRDYKLISQSDYVVVYYDVAVPSPGVVSEMNHALHSGKRVYGVWLPAAPPSPFFERYCTRSFRSADDLFEHFEQHDLLSAQSPPGADPPDRVSRRA